MPRPICLKCRVEMQCIENDLLVHDPAVGLFCETFNFCDRFRCPCCEMEIAVGFGRDIVYSKWLAQRIGRGARPYVHAESDLHLLDQYAHSAGPSPSLQGEQSHG